MSRVSKEQQVVNVMLHEYDKLRDELSQFTTSYDRFALLVITGLIALLAGIFNFNHPELMVGVPVLMLIFGAEELRRQFVGLYTGRYLSILERRINRLTDHEVLSWERHATLSRQRQSIFLRDGDRRFLNPDSIANVVTFSALIGLFAVTVFLSVKSIGERLQPDGCVLQFGAMIVYFVILVGGACTVLLCRFFTLKRSVDLHEAKWKMRWRLETVVP